MEPFNLGFFGAVSAGLLSFLSPCFIPLFPSYVSYVTGISLEEFEKTQRTFRFRVEILLNSVAFIVGFSLVFIALGAAATALGKVFLQYRQILMRIGGGIVILMGMIILGLFRSGFLLREWKLALPDSSRVRLLGSFLVGMGFSFGWSPCIGPFLGSILVLSASTQSVWQGTGLLAAYSLGFAVPFLAGSLALGSSVKLLRRLAPHINTLRKIAGGFIILIGVLIVLGYYERLVQFFIGLH